MPATPKVPSSLWGSMHQQGIGNAIEYHLLLQRKNLVELEKKKRNAKAKILELEQMLNTELIPQIEITKVRIIF